MTESLSAATSEQYHSCAHTAAPCTSNLSAPQKSMHGACLNLPVLPTRSNPPCTFLALALVLKAAISTTPCADLPRITPSAPADAGASPAGAGQGQQAGKERHAGCTPAHARCATGLCGVHMQNHNLLNGRPTWHITAAVPNTPPPRSSLQCTPTTSTHELPFCNQTAYVSYVLSMVLLVSPHLPGQRLQTTPPHAPCETNKCPAG